MDRDRMVFLRNKILFLKDVADAQWKHRLFLGASQGNFLKIGLRVDDIRKDINLCRHELRAIPGKEDRKEAIRAMCRDKIRQLLDIDSNSRRSAYIYLGVPKVGIDKSRSGTDYNITVGYRWLDKVFREIYQNEKQRRIGGYTALASRMVIIRADKVRVNSPHIDLYEVTALNGNIHQVQEGYVAIVKSEKRSKVFATTAALAIQKGQDLVNKEVTASLEGIL